MKKIKYLFVIAVLCASIGSFTTTLKADDPSNPPIGNYNPTPTPTPLCEPNCESSGNRSANTEAGDEFDFWSWYWHYALFGK